MGCYHIDMLPVSQSVLKTKTSINEPRRLQYSFQDGEGFVRVAVALRT